MKKLSLILVLLQFCLGCLSGLNKSEYYEEFGKLAEREDWAEAEILMKEAVKEHPDELNFHGFLSTALRSLGKHEEAYHHIKPVFERFPQSDVTKHHYQWSLWYYAVQIAEQGRHQQALELIETAIGLYPEDLSNMLWHGILLRGTGQLDQSIAVLAKANQIHDNEYIRGNLIYSYVEKAKALQKEQRNTEAEELYQKAMQINDEDATCLLWYGLFSYQTQKFEQGIGILEKGCQLFPEYDFFPVHLKSAYLEYGWALGKEDRLGQAIEVFQEAESRFPNEVLFVSGLMSYFSRLNRNDDAFSYLLKWLRLLHSSELDKKAVFDQENSIYYRFWDVMAETLDKKEFEKAKAMADQLRPFFTHQHFWYELKGQILRWDGQIEEGIRLQYEAYDLFIKDHPQYTKPVALD